VVRRKSESFSNRKFLVIVWLGEEVMKRILSITRLGEEVMKKCWSIKWLGEERFSDCLLGRDVVRIVCGKGGEARLCLLVICFCLHAWSSGGSTVISVALLIIWGCWMLALTLCSVKAHAVFSCCIVLGCCWLLLLQSGVWCVLKSWWCDAHFSGMQLTTVQGDLVNTKFLSWFVSLVDFNLEASLLSSFCMVQMPRFFSNTFPITTWLLNLWNKSPPLLTMWSLKLFNHHLPSTQLPKRLYLTSSPYMALKSILNVSFPQPRASYQFGSRPQLYSLNQVLCIPTACST
jgi:hypothetical protein